MNSKNLQPKIIYPAKLSLRIEGQIKSFTNKKKLKEFITTKPELYELLKGVLSEEKVNKDKNYEQQIRNYQQVNLKTKETKIKKSEEQY